MKYFQMRVLAFFLMLILYSCQSLELKIERRISLYEKYKTDYFDSLYIRQMREIYNPRILEFEVRKVKGEFLGYMQVKPEKHWHHNGDTMDVKFIEIFSELDCRKLYNYENFVFIEFFDRKKRVIIFKGSPNYKGLPHVNNYYIDTMKPTDYKNGWKYIIVDYKGEN